MSRSRTFFYLLDIVLQTIISTTQGIVLHVKLDTESEILMRNYIKYSTIEKPANISFTREEIFMGSSKLPMVTALTARRD